MITHPYSKRKHVLIDGFFDPIAQLAVSQHFEKAPFGLLEVFVHRFQITIVSVVAQMLAALFGAGGIQHGELGLQLHPGFEEISLAETRDALRREIVDA